jgi:hypothetical protein
MRDEIVYCLRVMKEFIERHNQSKSTVPADSTHSVPAPGAPAPISFLWFLSVLKWLPIPVVS